MMLFVMLLSRRRIIVALDPIRSDHPVQIFEK
jgi:hypothetical protein